MRSAVRSRREAVRQKAIERTLLCKAFLTIFWQEEPSAERFVILYHSAKTVGCKTRAAVASGRACVSPFA